MQRKHIYLLLFLNLILAVACGGSEESQTEKVVNRSDLDVFQVYELDTTATKVRFHDLVENVELMRLEETDASLLAYVTELIEVDDQYMFSSGDEGDIYFFSRKGKYESKINRKGEGPEEYQSVQNKWVSNDTLFVFTSRQNAIKKYNFDGDFLGSQKPNESPAQVVPYQDGYVLDMNTNLIDDSLAYNLVLLDEDFERQNLALPFEPQQRRFRIQTDFNGLIPYGNDYVYLRTMSDSLFLLRDGEVRPLIKFDFGRTWLFNDQDMQGGGQEVIDAIQNGNKVWNLGLRMNERWCYMTVMSGFTYPKRMIMDREKGTYRMVNTNISEGERYNLNAIRWEGDRLLFSIPSPNVAELLSRLDENRVTLRDGTTLEAIESSENPVMIWVKFKDQLE